jgi:hypothetical protein
MKKLYTVEIETVIIVAAENAEEALKVAEEVKHELEFESDHPQPMRYLPIDWDLDAVPFEKLGESNLGHTVGQWIELGAAPGYPTTKSGT